MISVIVPVYNVEKYLSACIESILASTYKEFELILVDDGSTDNSPQICDDYKIRDERIHVIHKRNGGLSSARNVGIDRAQGQYLTFIDSDDQIDVLFFEKLLYEIKKNDADVACAGIWWKIRSIQECCDGNTVNSVDKGSIVVNGGENALRLLYFVNSSIITTNEIVPACGKLYKKEVFNKLRFPISRYHEDEFIAHYWLYYSERICFLPEKLYFYFDRSDGITNQRNDKRYLDTADALLDRVKKCNEWTLSNELQQRVINSWVWYNIDNYKYLDRKDSRKVFRNSIKNNYSYVETITTNNYFRLYYRLWAVSPNIATAYELLWNVYKRLRDGSLT